MTDLLIDIKAELRKVAHWPDRLRRDFERDLRRKYRALSVAEQAGWRRWRDGPAICPACIAEFLRVHRRHQAWGVPANYDGPIRPDERCSRCRATPLTTLPPPGFLEAKVLEIYAHG